MRSAHCKTYAKAFLLFSIASSASSFVQAGTTSSWISSSSGLWTDPAAWSTAPNYPNNGSPAGTTYDAVIGDPNFVTVSLDTDITLDTFTLSNLIANFDHTAGILDVGTVTITAGNYNLNGGTLRNAYVGPNTTGLGGISVSRNKHGTLDNVTLARNLDVGATSSQTASLTVMNGLTLVDSGIVVYNGTLTLVGSQTISGSGVSAGTISGSALVTDNGTVTFGPNVSVSGASITGTGAIVNGGTINLGGGLNSINCLRFINNGTLALNTSSADLRHLDNNGTISLSGNGYTFQDWTNTGTIALKSGVLVMPSLAGNSGTIAILSASTLQLAGSYVPAELSKITRTGTGTIMLTGTLNNDAATVSLSSPPTKFAVLSPGGKISGGTITSAGVVQTIFNNGTIENATLVGTFKDLGAATLSNVVLADATLSNATLRVANGTASLSGTGTLENIALSNAPGSALVLPAGITSRVGGSFTTTGGVFRNRGHIRIPLGTSTTINSPDWKNEGSITLAGQLVLSGQSRLSDFGTVNRASTAEVLLSAGSLDLGDSTVDLGSFGTLGVSGGTLSNGTILANSSHQLKVIAPSVATFSNVATNSDLFPSQITYAGSGTLLNGSAIYLSNATLTLRGGTTLGGEGSIKLLGNSTISVSGGTFGADVNIVTAAGGGTIDGVWTNHGTITCNFGALSLRGVGQNLGVIRVDGGELGLDGTFKASNLGTIVKTGGLIGLSGLIINDAPVFDPSALPLVPKSGTINGGTVAVADPNAIPVHAPNASYFNLTDVTLVSNLPPQLMQSIRFANQLTLDDASVTFWPGASPNTGPWSAAGSGTFTLDTSLSVPNGVSSLSFNSIGPGIVVRTGAVQSAGNSTLTIGSASLNLANSGTISSESPRMTISTLSSASFTNSGYVIARNDGTFRTSRTTNLGSNTLVGGTWLSENGGVIAMTQEVIFTNVATVTISGATSRFDAMNSVRQNNGTLALLGGKTFTTVGTATLGFGNTGVLVIGSGSAFAIDGSLVNSGTVDLSGSMIIDHAAATPSPYAQIATQITAGRNGGTWDGATTPQFTSTAARNASPRTKTIGVLRGDQYLSVYGAGATFAGRSVDASSLLLRSTYYGDVDFNGVVDFDDYSRIDDGFNNAGNDWFHGDVNFDGIVDFDDYSLIDLAFNTQSNSLDRALLWLNGGDRSDGGMNESALRMVVHHFIEFGEPYAATFIAFAPEPSLGATGLLALMPLAIRRRKEVPHA